MEDNLYIECGNCWSLYPFEDAEQLKECPHCKGQLNFIKAVTREEPSKEQVEYIKKKG